MGASQSLDEQIRDAKDSIDNLHGNISNLDTMIKREVNRVETQIQNYNYTDLDEVCDKLEYYYVDKLNSMLPIKTLENYGRVHLGLKVEPITNDMEAYKNNVCKAIVTFHRKKLFLLSQIKQELPKCKAQE